jgi:hypothetical protein
MQLQLLIDLTLQLLELVLQLLELALEEHLLVTLQHYLILVELLVLPLSLNLVLQLLQLPLQIHPSRTISLLLQLPSQVPDVQLHLLLEVVQLLVLVHNHHYLSF